MNQVFHLDGMVVRDHVGRYVCEIIAYDNTLLTELLGMSGVLSTVQVDRDIKAANLQLLVGKVLEWEVRDSSFQLSPEVEPHFEQMLDLARSLKQ